MLEILTQEMVSYYRGDPQRIQHFIKVHDFARTIAQLEGMDADTLFILEAAAIVHDIGIKVSEEKYGSCAGNYQELEGPPVAREMLERLGFPYQVVDRVCFLVGHHHTYTNINALDYQILVEADFLVNFFEAGSKKERIAQVCDKLFRTKAGTRFIKEMFALDES